MKNRLSAKFDVVTEKNKLFVYVTPKKDTHITYKEIVELIYKEGYKVNGVHWGQIVQGEPFTIVYNLVTATDNVKETVSKTKTRRRSRVKNTKTENKT